MANKITLIVILALVVIGSVFFGSIIGQSQFVDLSLYGLVAAGVLYLASWHKYTWQICLFLAWSGMNFRYGFKLDPGHYMAVLLGTYGIIIILLRKNPYPRPTLFKHAREGRLIFWIALLLAYGLLSFALNRVMPYDGGSYALKNMAKAYFSAFAPSLFIVFALVMPYSFEIGKNPIKSLLIILFAATAVNVVNTFFLFRSGFSASATADMDPTEQVSLFYIPIINAVFSPYTMRTIGPLAALLTFAFLSYPGWIRRQSNFVRLLTLTTFALGLTGSVISGGRASLLICIFYLGMVCLVYRRIIVLVLAGMTTILLILLANVFSSTINNKAPMFVARPLQYVMIDKGKAMETIDNSSDYRSELFKAAIDEWQGDARVFLFGRSVYTSLDYKALKSILGDKESFIVVNLNSGTCHALLPSALLQYGILGTLLYYTVYLAILVFYWKLYRQAKRLEYSQDFVILLFVVALATTVSFPIATIGGGWFGFFNVVTIILFKSIAAREEILAEKQRELEEQRAVQQKRIGQVQPA